MTKRGQDDKKGDQGDGEGGREDKKGAQDGRKRAIMVTGVTGVTPFSYSYSYALLLFPFCIYTTMGNSRH